MTRVVYVRVSLTIRFSQKGRVYDPSRVRSCIVDYLVQSKGNRVWPESCTLVYRPTIRFSQKGRVYDPSRVRSCIVNYQVQSQGTRV